LISLFLTILALRSATQHKSHMKPSLTVGMIGSTGAVGEQAARVLAAMPEVTRLVLIGRRSLAGLQGGQIEQYIADVMQPESYVVHLSGLDAAICTLGIGQPSKVSREDFVRVDKLAALDFATACKATGVRHFSLLASVGTSAASSNHYLRTKGELEDGLRQLGFQRLSLFHPSMILTPANRYGLSQAILLKLWPILSLLMIGPASKYRGIRVDQLGGAMAHNLLRDKTGEEILEWEEIMELLSSKGMIP
jgi:uncharacterized protein YbjT (DUF2867 family)